MRDIIQLVLFLSKCPLLRFGCHGVGHYWLCHVVQRKHFEFLASIFFLISSLFRSDHACDDLVLHVQSGGDG